MPDDDLITHEQAMAARSILNQTPITIARALAVSAPTVRRAVSKSIRPAMEPRLARRLRSYFEGYGVEFLPAGQVRLKGGAGPSRNQPAACEVDQDAALPDAVRQATAMQLRAARRLLQWPQAEVAKANGWKVHVINEVETGTRHRPQAAETLKKFCESVGIIFHADGRVQVDASEE